MLIISLSVEPSLITILGISSELANLTSSQACPYLFPFSLRLQLLIAWSMHILEPRKAGNEATVISLATM